MQVEVPDTLNTMARSGSASSSSAPAPVASTSRPLEQDDDEVNVLSDIESQEAQRARDTTTTKPTSKKTRQQKPHWTEQLLQQMQENHALLQRVLLPQPNSLRESFIRYATDVLRSVSDTEYQELMCSFEDTMRRILSRRSLAAAAVPPPQASTSSAPPQAIASTAPPQGITYTAPPQQSTSTAPPHQQSTSTAPPQHSTSTTPPVLHQLMTSPSWSQARFFSPNNFYGSLLGLEHPPVPQYQPDILDADMEEDVNVESPSQPTTPEFNE